MLRTKGAWAEWDALPAAFKYLRPYRKLLALSIFMLVVGAVLALAEPWPLAIVIDSVLGKHGPPSILRPFFGSHPDKYALLAFLVALGFLQVILSHGLIVVNDYVNAKLEMNMVLDLRSDLVAHCQRLSLTFHDSQYTGQLMSRINNQAGSLGMVVMAFPPLAQSLLTLLGMLTIALFIDWQVTLVSMVAVPFIYYSLGVYGTRIVPRIRRVQGLEWASLNIVFEMMSMLRVVVSFGREKHEHRRFRDQGQTAVDARVRLTVLQTMFSLGVSTATALGTGLVLGFGAYHVLQGQITVGELIVLLSYIASVYTPLESISTTLGQLNQHFVYLKASLSLLDTEPEIKEDPHAVDIGRSTGHMTFEDVSFSYAGRVDTLRAISFDAPAGSRIAIVGPTGAGKTTLASLLVRFYDPAEGAISIDGVDVRRLTLSCLRDQISLVLQEPLLFGGTIAENIRYGRLDATRDEIVEAAKAANAHDFISKLPNAYETQLGEGGAQLSGGERQRICVARAFIKNAPILVLDEPTSSIDSKTETVILDALDELMVGRTSFMIAHRLSTIRTADLILVMNEGELVEHGTHDQLVAAGGLYSQLFDAQTKQRVKVRLEDDPGPVAGAINAAVREPVRPSGEPALAGGNGHAATENGGHSGAPNGNRLGSNGAVIHGHQETVKPRRPRPPALAKPNINLSGDVLCDACHRTLIRGESVVTFLAPSEERRGDQETKLVCELCWRRAKREGWETVRAADRHE
jgi:ATP-binding cassette subfamily B protein